ncbi:hypothetical protein SKAU_G00013220 [Synaphobranchus kaupii]|uniref:ARID domain-containing protein n=1 Tax=Synaphobranchus kaupii TaxID=118154 RepID=A0A9Q1GBN3_SYNKA|nr:hypothetical protein SKAU_G00013220 [Synaphobranchus kaupii]
MSAEEAEGALLSHHSEVLAKSRFLKDLYQFMESRDQPIERIPQLGFKELDLFLLYKTVQRFGGFDRVTAYQKWKLVYVMLGADIRSTCAATSTRRHYEKLLLPYERHLMRYSNTAMTPPTSLKRPRDCSPSVQDEGALRGSKRSATYRLPGTHPPLLPNRTLPQRSPGISTDCEMRITRKTTDYQTHGDPPCYHSLFPNIPPPQTNSQSHVYPHPHLHPLKSHCRQELRSLAQPAVIDMSKQSYSSSGWDEPLNLSCRRDGWDRAGRQLPSFAPPTDKKVPKFLNQVSHLYQAWYLDKKKPGNLPTRGAQQTQLELSSTMGHLDITANNSLERKFSLQIGELEGPSKLNRPLSDPSASSPGHIQTGFLQTLLQAKIKDRFGAPAVTMEAGGAAVTSSEKLWCQHGVAEPRPTGHGASKLRDQDWRSSFGSSFGEPGRWNGTQKGEESPLHPINMGSLCEQWKERELAPGRCGDARRSQPHVSDSEAPRPFHIGWLELQAGRQCPGSQPTPVTRCPPGPVAMRKQEASQYSLGPGVGPKLLEGIPATGPSEVLKDDVFPPLVMRLTPEEYWNLRQLVSAPFRNSTGPCSESPKLSLPTEQKS